MFSDVEKPSISLSGWQWIIVLSSVMTGYLVLIWVPTKTDLGQVLVRVLFVGLPSGTWLWVTRTNYKALFRPFGVREAAFAALIALCAFCFSVLTALVVSHFWVVAPNRLVISTAEMSASELVLQLLSMVPQLLGEEILTILPFLALLQLGSSRFGLGRKTSVLMAVAGSTFVFSAAHLPTYDWNLVQCFGIIGTPRVILTLAFLITRNLWVSTAAHVLTDWTEFTIAFMAASHRADAS